MLFTSLFIVSCIILVMYLMWEGVLYEKNGWVGRLGNCKRVYSLLQTGGYYLRVRPFIQRGMDVAMINQLSQFKPESMRIIAPKLNIQMLARKNLFCLFIRSHLLHLTGVS